MSYQQALKFGQSFYINQGTIPDNYLNVQDITNWAAEGITGGDTADCILQIVDPLNIPMYENAGYAIDDYSSPDTTLSSPNLNQLALPISGGLVLAGEYVINVKAKIIKGSDPVVYVQKSIKFTLCPNVLTLELCLQLTFDCDDATANGKDLTKYVCDDYPEVSVTRSLVIMPPPGYGQSNTTSSTDTVQATDLLSPTTYFLKLNSTVVYQTDDYVTTVNIKYEKEIQEDTLCDDVLCKIYCCLKKVEEKFSSCKNNPGDHAKAAEALLLGNVYYNLAKDARRCGHENLVSRYIERFYQYTGCDPKCDCCGSTVAPVIPKGDCNCHDGANGRELEIQIITTEAGNLVFQSRYVGEASWTTLYILNIETLTTSITNDVIAAITSTINSTVATGIAEKYIKVYGVNDSAAPSGVASTWQHPVASGPQPYKYGFNGTDVLSANNDEVLVEAVMQVNTVEAALAFIRVHLGQPSTANAIACSIQHALNNAVATSQRVVHVRARIVRKTAGKVYMEMIVTESASSYVENNTGSAVSTDTSSGVAAGYLYDEFDFTDASKAFINIDFRVTAGDFENVTMQQLSVYSIKKRT